MKHARPWYRQQTDSWYVVHHGKQKPLGKHPEEAPPPQRSKKTGDWNPPPAILTAFHTLMAAAPEQLPKPERLTVAKICDLFLDFAQKNNDERTYRWYHSYLQHFCRGCGRLLAKDLIELHVDQWLDAHPTWKTGRGCAIRALKRCFNWAEKKGVLRPNPILGVARPSVPSRARKLTKPERAEILAAIRDEPFRLFVEAMQESGCRPSEVTRVTAENVNLELGVWVLHKHKTAKKTGKPRVIYLTPRLLEITKEQLEKYSTGHLFRGPRMRKPFGMNGICSRFQRLRKKLPHLKDAIAYAYRHSFAMDALTAGVGIAQVSELLGHSDTSMVSRHYGNLADQIGHLRDAARKATGG